MWPFKKNKFKKLTREEVVDSICTLEKRETDLEEGIVAKGKLIDELMIKGRQEKSRDMQIFYAKKITALKEEKETDIKRGLYLLYNIKLAKKLKDAIDDNQFIADTGKVSMSSLLSDQKGLAKFLNSALNTKVAAEQVLTSADDVFNEVKNAYVENDTIYGVQNNDDQLLAMFETGDMIDSDLGAQNTETEKEKDKSSL